jgi:hypothetical protein
VLHYAKIRNSQTGKNAADEAIVQQAPTVDKRGNINAETSVSLQEQCGYCPEIGSDGFLDCI